MGLGINDMMGNLVCGLWSANEKKPGLFVIRLPTSRSFFAICIALDCVFYLLI